MWKQASKRKTDTSVLVGDCERFEFRVTHTHTHTHAHTRSHTHREFDDDDFYRESMTTELWSPEDTEDLDVHRRKDYLSHSQYCHNGDSPLREEGGAVDNTDNQTTTMPPPTTSHPVPTLINPLVEVNGLGLAFGI